MKRIIYSVALICIASLNLETFAQTKTTDPTLFTFGGTPVGKSEFLRMYTKNINNQKPDFSEKAI